MAFKNINECASFIMSERIVSLLDTIFCIQETWNWDIQFINELEQPT